MKELDDVFEEETEVSTETEETTEEENTEGEETAETEETETAEVEESEEEVPATPEPKLVPLAAVQDERRKRQELEQRLQALESKLPKPNDEPDIYEDPDAWKEWNRNQIIEEQNREASRRLETRINESRERMLETAEDFTRAENAFMVMVQSDPSLTQQMLESLDPAKFAYEKGNEFLNSLIQPVPTKAPNIPVSLAKASAKGANAVEVEKDDDDLKAMFADQKY